MIRLENVAKTYQTRNAEVRALDEINLQIEEGEFVVIRGPSGSGKTTLLMTIAGMLRPTRGIVSMGPENLYAMSIRKRARFRAENIGFVFQEFALVPYLNIAENISLAAGVIADKSRKARIIELIDQLGLRGRNHHKPSELSSGEKQRTAIARALLNRPKILLADEPTGNLDPDNASAVLGHIADFQKGGGTVILATHGSEAQQFAGRMVELRNGHITNYGSQEGPASDIQTANNDIESGNHLV